MTSLPSLTILVADEHPLTAGVRALLGEWVRVGMLSPGSLWISGGSDNVVELTPEGEVPRDLQARLASLEVGLIRLLAIQVVGDDGVGKGVPEAAISTRELMERVLSPTQAHVTLNAIVAAPGVPLSIRDCIDPAARANVVVSPEDRRTQDTATIDLHSPEQLVAHAALATATIGSLWPGMAEGPFDQRTVGVSGDGRHVVAARCAGRVLLCEDIVEELLEQLFDRRNQGDLDPGIVEAEPAANPRKLGTDVARSLGAADGVKYVEPEVEGPPPSRSIGLWQAFLSMFRHLWSRLRSAPRRFVDRRTEELRRQVEAMAQKFVYGDDSTMSINFASARSQVGSPDVEALQEAAARLAASLSDEKRAIATPQVWRNVRESAFAIVDGSAMPQAAGGRTDERFVVAQDLWAAVPDPQSEVLTVRIPGASGTEQVELPACDPRTVSDAMQDLTLMVKPSSSNVDEERGTDAPKDAHEVVEAAAEQLDEVQQWVGHREGGMLWEFGRELDNELKKATRAFQSSFQRAQAELGEPDEAGFKRARRKLRAWWTFATVLSILAVLGGIRGLQEVGDTTAAVGYFVLVAVAALLGYTLAYLGFERRLFKLMYQYNARLIDQRNALLAVEHDAREVARLKALYEQYKDWTGIIGWVVHHPEGADVEAEELPDLPEILHPEALRLATGRPSDDFAEHLVSKTARRVFARGWLKGLYTQAADEAMSRYRMRRGLSTSASTVDPDNDTSEKGARRFLLQELQDGDLSSSWRHDVRRALTQEFSAVPPTELFDQVCELPSAIAEAEVTATSRFFATLLPSGASLPEFPPGQWTTSAVVDRRHAVDQVMVWAPKGVLTAAATASVTMHELDSGADDGPLRVRALRLDLTAECDPRSLKCFASDLGSDAADAADFDTSGIG